MCGIAGFIQSTADPALLDAMLASLAHRGPDGHGTWHGSSERGHHVSLGHRRLAILDLVGGQQPLASSDGARQITFNGEIYNFAALRARLQAAGHRFATSGDTEVIVQHYAGRGLDAFADLDGMFALALWDDRQQRLVLARDRCGVKPLYYAELPGGGLVFASELTAVLRHPAVDRRLSDDGLRSYFFSDYAHAPLTLVRGVKKLAPGHLLVWERGRLASPRPFWQLREGSPLAPGAGGEPELARQLWGHLEQAVERQLVADVPIGVFLSGGLDSSAVAAVARRLVGGRLPTFSLGFERPDFDESGYARQVARHLDTEHTEQIVRDRDVLDAVLPALDHLDEPLADPSFVPTYLVARLAARHVKVVLGGDGGDELFGGYPTYLAHRHGSLYGALPALVRERVVPRLLAPLPVSHGYQSLEWKLRRFALRWDDSPGRRHLRWMSSTDVGDLDRLLPRSGSAEPATLRADLPVFRDRLNGLLAVDFLTYLPGSVLAKVDRAAMAHGLEVRPPLLDQALVDWAYRLPSALKVRRGQTKVLFKRAALAHLPRAIVRRPKQGFAIPAAAWLRGPLRGALDEVFAQPALWEAGLDRAVLRSWYDEHMSMRADRGKPLWALLVLGRWARRVLGAPPATLPADPRP